MEGQRRIWGPIFLVAGLLGLVALGWLALDPAPGLPVALITWAVTIYAGYRIWRAGHPAASAWRDLGRRAQAVGGVIVTLVAVGLIQAFPQVVVAIVAVWLAAMVALVVGLAIASQGIDR